ncbi:MAG: hypothetical protein NUV97_01365 [archaeon]|nr:hypothetical protein [archaeon]
MTQINKVEIIKAVIQELQKSFETDSMASDKGIPIYKNILYVLEKYNTKSYYGTLNIKITGPSCFDIKESEVTHKLDNQYNY